MPVIIAITVECNYWLFPLLPVMQQGCTHTVALTLHKKKKNTLKICYFSSIFTTTFEICHACYHQEWTFDNKFIPTFPK